MDVIDSKGDQVYWTCWLVKKSAYEDGSFKTRPQDAYKVTDMDTYYAEKPFDENAPSMLVEVLVFRDNYVVVAECDFDTMAKVQARKERYARRQAKNLGTHEKQKKAYLTRQNPVKTAPWWRRLFS